MIIDLTPTRDGTGPARLLDIVEGRSKAVVAGWLAERDPAWRDAIEVVAMDGFTGFKTATGDELPDAVAVMDPSRSSIRCWRTRTTRDSWSTRARSTRTPRGDR